MREYEIYLPLHFNDGTPIPPARIQRLTTRLVEQFGGLTHFPQENEGLWKVGSVTFRDRIVILRVLAAEAGPAEKFLARLKKKIQRDWKQESLLIIAREVVTL